MLKRVQSKQLSSLNNEKINQDLRLRSVCLVFAVGSTTSEGTNVIFERIANTLIRQGGYTGWSESMYFTMFCQKKAQL